MVVCELCLESCEKCSAPLSHKVEGDCYDDGYVWTVQGDSNHCYCADCHTEAEEEAADETWRTCYSDRQRLDYIRENWSQFERCKAKWNDPHQAWRELLACVRGRVFFGYASELLG